MSRTAFLVYAGVVALIALLTGRMAIISGMDVIEGRAPQAQALASAGLAIATLGPLALSATIWLGQRRFKAGWLLHILFIPCAIILFNAGSSMLLGAANVPDDNSAEGYALGTGILLLALTILIHVGALVARGIAAADRWDSRS